MPGERFLDDDVLAALEGRDGEWLVRGWGSADINDVRGVAQFLEGVEGFHLTLARKPPGRLGRFRGNAHNLDRHAVNAPIPLPVETRRKPRADDSDADGLSHALRCFTRRGQLSNTWPRVVGTGKPRAGRPAGC